MDSILAIIAPHWSLSYPEYLNLNQSSEEQQSVVWSRLRNHRATVAKRLSKEREQYLAARQELNPRTTQVKSSHEPLSRDTVVHSALGLYPIRTLNGDFFVLSLRHELKANLASDKKCAQLFCLAFK